MIATRWARPARTVLALLFLASACRGRPVAQRVPATQPMPTVSTPQPSPAVPSNAIADVDPRDLCDTLASLARAHSQKSQLAFWVSTPLRPVDAPFKPFFANMGKTQGELLNQLKAWAKQHNVDLTFHFTSDTAGTAQKLMEDREEKLVRGDSQADFERDILMQMYTDFDWQISQLQVLQPKIKDPGLKAYVDKSLQVHEEGLREISRLLKSFKFAVK